MPSNSWHYVDSLTLLWSKIRQDLTALWCEVVERQEIKTDMEFRAILGNWKAPRWNQANLKVPLPPQTCPRSPWMDGITATSVRSLPASERLWRSSDVATRKTRKEERAKKERLPKRRRRRGDFNGPAVSDKAIYCDQLQLPGELCGVHLYNIKWNIMHQLKKYTSRVPILTIRIRNCSDLNFNCTSKNNILPSD